jgi:hypothetical protein
MSGFLWFVGSEALTAVVMKSTIFQDITPCSPLEVNRRFGEIYRLHLQVWRISQARNQPENRWQAEQSILKIEAICSSETSVEFQRTTCFISEDSIQDLFSCTWLFLYSAKMTTLLLLILLLLLLWRCNSVWVHKRARSSHLNTMTGSALPQYRRDRTQSTVEINQRTFPVGDHRHLHTTRACFVNRKAYHS